MHPAVGGDLHLFGDRVVIEGSRLLARRIFHNMLDWSCALLLRTNDAAETDVVGAGIDRMVHPRGRTVALAVVLRAGEGAAFQHLAGNGADPGSMIDA